jgi:hypothetical protein
MIIELPDWIKDASWPNGDTVRTKCAEKPSVSYLPASRLDLKEVWERRLQDAVAMDNKSWKARTQEVCNWLDRASDNLMMLIVGEKPRVMLVDIERETTLPM